MWPLTLLTSPLEKGLAAAVVFLLTTSGLEALVIKYEMTSKNQCVSAVTATNAETKTVTTAIRNVDNASTQAIQSSVSNSIAADVASLHDSESSPASSSLSGISGSSASSSATPSPTSDQPKPVTFTVDQASAEACLTAYDIAKGWQQWYDQTQANWQNIEGVNGKHTSRSDLLGTEQSAKLEDLLFPVPSPVWPRVRLGQENVRQEQPVRDQSNG